MSFSEILFWIWLAITILSLPFFTKILAKHFVDGNQDISDLDTEDKVMSVFLAMCISWAWPLCIPGYWIYEFTFGRNEK